MTAPHVLRNGRGMRVAVSGHDAGLQSWWAPDRYGRMADVLAVSPHAAHRQAGWQCEDAADASLRLHLSREGLCVRLHYQLSDDGSLRIECEAVADGVFCIGLPAPSFNLQGRGAGVGDHVLRLAADRYRPGGAAQGGPHDVAGSAFDFRQPAPLGARLAWPALAGQEGFRHDFFLAGGGRLQEAARVADPASGRVLRYSSAQAGLQLRSDVGGICLAAQDLELQPGRAARATLLYRLGVQDIEAFDISEPISMALNK
ncbi:hypothetical protein O0880_18375 [Janthinobacterium sp. SUN118]|uniref:aldose epimerase family protein n=1 Tax=Janthinobacterium sp. SUN118 TaxID=3004100 RepID=UPI0025B00090|nr:hypothetical protein [Janthinobacterium sp. SUN118]MDN2711390.1 hypothetical protein [Janthinobacterium sp. SUN118]